MYVCDVNNVEALRIWFFCSWGDENCNNVNAFPARILIKNRRASNESSISSSKVSRKIEISIFAHIKDLPPICYFFVHNNQHCHVVDYRSAILHPQAFFSNNFLSRSLFCNIIFSASSIIHSCQIAIRDNLRGWRLCTCLASQIMHTINHEPMSNGFRYIERNYEN
jgi:hypothetical protein